MNFGPRSDVSGANFTPCESIWYVVGATLPFGSIRCARPFGHTDRHQDVTGAFAWTNRAIGWADPTT